MSNPRVISPALAVSGEIFDGMESDAERFLMPVEAAGSRIERIRDG